MNFRNLKLLLLSVALTSSYASIAQDASADSVKKSPTPVKHIFEHSVVINNQTVEKPAKKALDFIIQHRFGVLKNFTDLGGVYGPANIRLGLDYGVTKRLSVGVGATKNKHYYDLEWKYILMNQMKDGGFPVSIAYYGDVARSADSKDKFINQDQAFKSQNKLTYFHELMFARKVTSRVSLQLAGTYSHFNIIDSLVNEHNFFGASFVGKYRFSPQSSIQVEFDNPLNVSSIPKDLRPKPNLGLGFEVSTSGHQFQVFVCTANGIINQEMRVYNLNDFTKREVMIGFNITRQWGF